MVWYWLANDKPDKTRVFLKFWVLIQLDMESLGSSLVMINDPRPSKMHAIFPNQYHGFINILRSSSVSFIVHVFANSPSNPNLLVDMF